MPQTNYDSSFESWVDHLLMDHLKADDKIFTDHNIMPQYFEKYIFQLMLQRKLKNNNKIYLNFFFPLFFQFFCWRSYVKKFYDLKKLFYCAQEWTIRKYLTHLFFYILINSISPLTFFNYLFIFTFNFCLINRLNLQPFLYILEVHLIDNSTPYDWIN